MGRKKIKHNAIFIPRPPALTREETIVPEVERESRVDLEQVQRVQVTVPLASKEDLGYCKQHVNVNLKGAAANVAKRLFIALDELGERIPSNNRRVASQADAIRWLFEHLARE